LIRAHVDLTAKHIRFHALRRREPTWHPDRENNPVSPFPERKFRDIQNFEMFDITWHVTHFKLKVFDII
jgi:hypothetical protein